ncbi:hypothetical protein Vretifemale_2631 [Volvox reticuliferus]|nr:hypothetical protein Vretifemale_2631 [Volvox reticuliferus]
MAPEVLVCPDKRRPEENKDKVLLGYTAQVDSWAVGILAYELLVGYPPFEQESRAATYEHIMYKEPKFPSWMTEEAKKFIGLALCKNASQRPTVFDLMQHSWVQPYMMRHLQPAPSSGLTPGPSRLRNSVSHTSGDSGTRDSVPSASTNGMLVPHAHQHVSISASGMAPTGTTVGAPSGMAMGTGGRLFVPVPAPPASAPAAASTTSAASASAQQSTADSGALKQLQSHVHPHPHAHAQMHSHPQQQLQQSQTQSGVPTPSHRQQANSPNVALKTSISLHEKPPPGSQDTPITGVGAEGGRLHESISDPSARAFETCVPHPPGATSSASLYSGGGGVGGSGSSTGNRGACGAPTDTDRAVSQSQSHSLASGASANGGVGVRASQLLSSGPSTGSLGMRGLVHVTSHGNSHMTSTSASNSRLPAPPLTLDPVEATSDLSCGGVSSTEHMPISPATAARGLNGAGMGLGPGVTPMASRTTHQSFCQAPGAPGGGSGGGMPSGLGGTVAPPRLRMAALVPPVNIGAASISGGSVRMMHAPAPPISPKPPTPDMQGAYHRPASGVLSDDSFLPPTRSPSISLGTQLLSPLQLLAPRPSSRLNSPSHSRRNSVSQAGQAGGQTSATATLQQASMPLPQLLSVEYGDLSAEESAMRTSNSHRGLMTAPTSGATGSKLFGKMWTRDPISSGGAPPLSVVCSADSLDSPVPGASVGGGMMGRGGNAVAPISAGPAAVSAAGGARVTARVRMMTPDEMITRPLMRESSMSSSFKSSAGGSGMREDLMQQSLTVYHRPGKVPGIGRAALAAREADAVEAANLSLGHGPSGGLGKTKSLVNRNLNGVLAMEEGGCGGAQMARMGSDAALARTAAGAAAAAAASGHAVATQRSFTSSNSAFARKLANGAIATKVTEYVKGRLPHDEDMAE